MGHNYAVNSAAFSPDGKRIVTASRDTTTRLWDTETGQTIRAPLTGHTNWVNSVAFSPEGRLIVTASWDGTARLWEVFANTQDLITHAKVIVPKGLIPRLFDHDPWAQDRKPIDVIFHGWSIKAFQAKQQ
jgi:WD40 repeat protein